MLVNSDLTLYHKTLNNLTKIEEYSRHYYEKVWCYLSESATLNKGVNKSNNLVVRISYELNPGLDINDINKDDIVIIGNHEDINSVSDLKEENFYKVVGITNNTFGTEKHIHLRCQ